MPFYDYGCPACGKVTEVFHSIKDVSEHPCPDCGAVMTRRISAETVSGHVKGMTPGKALKESKLRRKRNAELGVRQIERYGGQSRLVPNVGGEELGTWKEAEKKAADEGKDTTGYRSLAEKERHTQNSSGIDERKWKKAKEVARTIT